MNRFSLALMLGLSLLSLARAAPWAATPADSCNFSRHIDYSLVVAPPRDCVGQALSLVVHSCRECDQILSGAQADDGSLYLQFQSQQVCPVGVYCRDDSLVIPLRPLPPGTHSIEVHVSASVITGLPDTTTCNLEQLDHFTFDVLSCPGTLPFVSDVQIGDRPDGTICPRDSIPVSVYVEMPSPCFRFLGLRLAPSDETVIGPPVVEVLVDACPTCFYCPPEPIPYVAKVVLPPLPLGSYPLQVREVWSGQADTSFNAVYPFSVVDACSTSGSFPMVKVVEIGGPACPSCPLQVCPGDSVRVFISGEFPSTCWEFHGVDVLPDSFGGSRPPRLRVNLYRDGCNPPPCAAVVVPFYAALRLPPLAPGSYVLHVEEQQGVSCGPQQNFPHRVGFQVADQCSTVTPFACLMENWVHGADRCDAHVNPDHPGDVEMTLVSHGLPLAGLQGELHFLQIDTSLQPVALEIG